MSEQLTFPLRRGGPKINPRSKLLAQVLAYLRTRPGWVKRAAIVAALNASDRSVRAAIAESAMILSNSEEGGYKHMRHATPAEFSHYRNELLSRVGHLQSRIVRADRAWHKFNAVKERRAA